MTVTQLINDITTKIFNPLIILLFAVATMMFAWGIVQYVLGGQGSDQKMTQAKNAMLWGIIGMFVMASAWGIVAILCKFFDTCKQVPGFS
ncbi:MAG: pilin [Patescibacteria group bacterium]